MAQLLTGLLSISLPEVGKSIGMSLISASTSKIFSLLVGSDPNGEIKRKLDEISLNIHKLTENITELDKDIEDMRLDIKTDLVQTFINNINALYEQYMAILLSLMKPKLHPDQKTRNEIFHAERQRLADIGHKAANEVYAWAEQMDVFLAGQGKSSLLYLINLQALRDSKDFLGHFVKIKTFMINMYVPQLKALELLRFAFFDPEVNFDEGNELIDKVNHILIRQEEFWNATVGDLIIKLATRVIESPEVPVSVNFTWGDKTAIHSDVPTYPGVYSIDNSEERRWTLEPVTKVDPSKTDVQNFFLFRETVTNATMDIEGGELSFPKFFTGMRAVEPSPDNKGQWFLQSTESGLFQVRYNSTIIPLPPDVFLNGRVLQAVRTVMPPVDITTLETTTKDTPTTDATTLFKIQAL